MNLRVNEESTFTKVTLCFCERDFSVGINDENWQIRVSQHELSSVASSAVRRFRTTRGT